MAKKRYKKSRFNSLLPWILVGSITSTCITAYFSDKKSEIIDYYDEENKDLKEKLKEEQETSVGVSEDLEEFQKKKEIFEKIAKEEDYDLKEYELLNLEREELEGFDSIKLDNGSLKGLSDEEFDMILDKIRAMPNLKDFIFVGESDSNYKISQDRVNKLIAVLGEKKSLTKLELSYLDIQDITFLENLTELEELSFLGNDISDISVLSNLKKLKMLNIGVADSVTDFTSLKNLTSLERLYLSGKITDASVFSSLTNLKRLFLCAPSFSEKEGLENLKDLGNLTQLEYLEISHTNLSDITFLESMPHLQELDLGYCELTNIGSISTLKELEILSLVGNNIQDITPLKDLTNLKELDLKANQIVEIDALENLVNLQELDLSCNQIQNIDALKGLTQLKNLYLENNQIKNIDALEALVQLEILHLNNNQITSVEPLHNMQNLKELNIENNMISSLDGIINVTFKKYDDLYNFIEMRGNPIPDADIIEFLIAHEEVYIYDCFDEEIARGYKEAIDIRRALKDVQVLGVEGAIGINELLTYDTKWLRDYETVILEDNFFDLYQTEYDQILKKLRELPHVKYLKIIGPPCYPGTHEDIAKLETPENIDKMIEAIMMMKELESLDIEFVYGLNNAHFVYDLTNLTSIDLSYNGLPDEEVKHIHEFINGKQKVYPN